MPRVGFQPTFPASKRAKRVHALDHSATVTGPMEYTERILNCGIELFCSVPFVIKSRDVVYYMLRVRHIMVKSCISAFKYCYCYSSGQWTRHIYRGTKMKFLVLIRVFSFEMICLLVCSAEDNSLFDSVKHFGNVTSRFLMITELLHPHIVVMDAKI
jgi:hypothetical protein